jgi:hypothetical protein
MSSAVPVSVITPTRNEASNIDALLEDLLRQRRRVDEILIVDTGSTDDTRERVQRMAARDARVRLLRVEDGYPGAGRNAGLVAARSEWVAFIDAGMRVDDHWLSHLLAPVDSGAAVDAVLGGLEPLADSAERRVAALAYVPWRRPAPSGGQWRGECLPSCAVRRSVSLELGGFPESLRSGEDMLFLRSLLHRARVAHAPHAIVHWSHAATRRAVWQRFRTYAEHSLRGGTRADWVGVMVRRYVAMAALTGPTLPFSATALLLLRAAIMQRRKPEFVEPTLPGRVVQLVRVAAMLGIIDAATWTAWFSWKRTGSMRVAVQGPLQPEEEAVALAGARPSA